MKQARLGYWLRVVGLPLLLVLLTAAVLGSHYETNDDFCITLLLRGRTAAAPVTDLHLYFHGWAWLLAQLYTHWPAVPWYGLTLYALLTLALVLLTAVLERLLTPYLRPWPRAALLTVFLLLAGLEHAQWFNYVRVPVLLGGGAVLWAAQQYAARYRPGRRWVLPLGVLLFAAAWAIRPSAAVLGAAVVAPAAWWLGGRGGWRVVAAVAATALLLGAAVQLTRSPEAARYRRLDVLKSNVLDYLLYSPAPQRPADSLAVRAVDQWVLGDSTLVNEALFARAYQPNPQFWPVVLPYKLSGLRGLLLRDYFALLLLHALLLALGRGLPRPQRRGQWLYALGLGLLLLALGVGLKLPPRLAGPLLTLTVVAHLALVAPRLRELGPAARRLGYGLLVLASVLYLFKTGHRREVLRREEQRNVVLLQRLTAAPGRIVLGINVEETFKSLSPFRQYVPAAGPPWLLLTGWPTLDPSQARLRQLLTGTRDQAEALRRLHRRPADVHWADTEQLAPGRQVLATYWRRGPGPAAATSR